MKRRARVIAVRNVEETNLVWTLIEVAKPYLNVLDRNYVSVPALQRGVPMTVNVDNPVIPDDLAAYAHGAHTSIVIDGERVEAADGAHARRSSTRAPAARSARWQPAAPKTSTAPPSQG